MKYNKFIILIGSVIGGLFLFGNVANAIALLPTQQAGTGLGGYNYPKAGAILFGKDNITLATSTNLTFATSTNTLTTRNLILTGTCTGCGGTPASPDTSVQFNNSGAFGGSSSFTWDNTAKQLNVTGNQNDSTQINVSNNNNGNGAVAAVSVGSDASSGLFGVFGSGTGSYGAITAGSVFINSGAGYPLVLQADSAAPIIFATGAGAGEDVGRFDGSGNFLLKKHSAFGNTAVVDEGGSGSVLLNLQETNTNPNGFQGLTMDGSLYNPSGSGGSATGVQGQMRTMTGNPYDINTIEGGYFYGWHSGDGNVDNIIGAEMGAFDSDSTAGYNISNFTGSLIQNGHTATAHVDNGFGQKITTALGAASTMSNYSDLYLSAPTYDGSPTIGSLTGLTIEDHSGLGTSTAYNIKSIGGTNWFTGGVAGQSAVNIGNMGGGVLTPTYTVLTQASNLFTDNSGAYVGEFMQTVAKPDDTTVGAQTIGLLFNVFTDAGNSGDWSMYGSSGFVVHNGSGYGQATGAYNFAGNGGAGTASLIGANNVGENDGTSASNSVDYVIGSDNLGINAGFGADHGQWVTDMAATRSTISNGSSARVTRGYGEWVVSATGKYGDNYGIYIEDQSGVDASGATYNLFSAGANSKNYFAGNVGIASTTPGSLFSIGTTGGINFLLGTSTFGTSAKGINLNVGCFSIRGACVGTSDSTKQATSTTNDLVSQSGAVASVASTTAPNDGVAHTYSVGAYTAITAISAGTLTVQLSFTDENNASQTVSYISMGLTSAGLTTTGFTPFNQINIRAKANTVVTVKTAFTGVSITYDIGATITKLN